MFFAHKVLSGSRNMQKNITKTEVLGVECFFYYGESKIFMKLKIACTSKYVNFMKIKIRF